MPALPTPCKSKVQRPHPVQQFGGGEQVWVLFYPVAASCLPRASALSSLPRQMGARHPISLLLRFRGPGCSPDVGFKQPLVAARGSCLRVPCHPDWRSYTCKRESASCIAVAPVLQIRWPHTYGSVSGLYFMKLSRLAFIPNCITYYGLRDLVWVVLGTLNTCLPRSIC